MQDKIVPPKFWTDSYNQLFFFPHPCLANHLFLPQTTPTLLKSKLKLHPIGEVVRLLFAGCLHLKGKVSYVLGKVGKERVTMGRLVFLLHLCAWTFAFGECLVEEGWFFFFLWTASVGKTYFALILMFVGGKFSVFALLALCVAGFLSFSWGGGVDKLLHHSSRCEN